MRIKIILLDLGGVLVELAGVKRLIELMGNNITPDELSGRWAKSEYVNLYESGKCDTTTFARGFIKEFNIDISPEDFIKEFILYAKDFFPGVVELLREIKSKYTLACLSNTNISQWNGLCERISIDKYFDYNFLSFEIGVMKPEPGIYTYAIEKLGCNPDEIAFFDDTSANIQAGINAGMNAYRVVGVEDLREKLRGLGLM